MPSRQRRAPTISGGDGPQVAWPATAEQLADFGANSEQPQTDTASSETSTLDAAAWLGEIRLST